MSSAVKLASRLLWIGPLCGLWLLVCAVFPALVFGGGGHGSIFLVQPPSFAGVAGAVIHSLVVIFRPERELVSVFVALLIALLASAIGLGATAIYWATPFSELLATPLAAIPLVLSLASALSVSRLYLRRRIVRVGGNSL